MWKIKIVHTSPEYTSICHVAKMSVKSWLVFEDLLFEATPPHTCKSIYFLFPYKVNVSIIILC